MDLLERGLQLGVLSGYADEVGDAEGRLVLVAGEAGVGKTALVEALQGILTQARWAWGSCDGLFTPRPLGPLLDMASGLGGGLLAALQAGRPREDIFQALLAELAGCTPYAVLVFEDVHWADEATLDLLRFLSNRLRRIPVLVLVTYRDDEVPAGHPLRRCLAQLSTERSTRRVDVPRLTPAAVERLAEGTDLSPELLHHLTGGNPYFLTELLRHSSTDHLPTSARDAVLGRAETVSRDAQRLLGTAALIGHRVDLDLLGELMEVGVESLDELVESGLLLAEGGELRFRHEIARLAVAETVPPHRAAPVHTRVLALLEARDDADEARLAHHAEGAADPAAVLLHATPAARHAASVGSHREAAAQYERALRWAGRADARTRAELHDCLSTEYGLLDDWAAATLTREAALELWRSVGDRVREAGALRMLAVCHWRECRGEEAATAATEALDLLRGGDDDAELARCLAGASALAMCAGETQRSIRLADEAIDLAGRLDLPDVLSDALNTRAGSAFVLGDPWQENLERALELALAAGADVAAARAFANLQALSVSALDFTRAEYWFGRGLEFCEGHDMPTYGNCLAAEHVTTLEKTGHWDEALRYGRDRLGNPHLSTVNRLSTWLTVGRILARRGNPEAWVHLDAAHEHARTLAEPQYLALVHLARAEAHWLAADDVAARQEALAAAAYVDRVDPWQRGHAAAWLRRLDLPSCPGDVTGPYASQVRGDVAAAAAGHGATGNAYEAALALADSDAEQHRREALRTFDALGATAAASLVRRLLREAGATAVPNGARPSTRSHPCGLTRREHEVLVELASGSTNEEIAGRLVIATKTVDHHVSAVLGKLGVANRREASAEAARLGLLLAQPGES